MDSIRTLDLFCGAGGSSRGAQMAGAEIVAGVDMWETASAVFQANFPSARVYNTAISDLSSQQVTNEVGEIDLLLASPPCTNHSVARGNKIIDNESGDTAFEVVRFVEALRPRWIVVENVVQMRDWDRFREWCRCLGALGYSLHIDTQESQYHDVPQSRRRLFVVGDLECVPTLPSPKQHTKKTIRNSVLGKGESPTNPWKFSPVDIPTRAFATVVRVNIAKEHLGHETPFILIYYGTDKSGRVQVLDRPLRTVTTINKFAYIRPGSNGHEMRMLQPPELAAAMGFPEAHLFPANYNDKIKLIGNGVCPPVMAAIVSSLQKGEQEWTLKLKTAPRICESIGSKI